MTYSLGYWFGADHSAGNHQPAAIGEMVAAMRLVLAASALLVIGMDPVEPDHFPVATHVTLLLYAGYSLALYLLRKRRLNTAGRRLATAHPRWTHWADVAWFTLLAALSTGTHGILFGFFFAILTGSFTHGLREGWRVTVVSTLLFGLEEWLTAAILSGPSFSEYGFEWNGFFLRPIYLLVLGYMIAYWGGYEIEIKRRLAFLWEVSALSNPRFGIDHTSNTMLERLRAFYDADLCFSILPDKQGEYHLRQIRRVSPPGQRVVFQK